MFVKERNHVSHCSGGGFSVRKELNFWKMRFIVLHFY